MTKTLFIFISLLYGCVKLISIWVSLKKWQTRKANAAAPLRVSYSGCFHIYSLFSLVKFSGGAVNLLNFPSVEPFQPLLKCNDFLILTWQAGWNVTFGFISHIRLVKSQQEAFGRGLDKLSVCEVQAVHSDLWLHDILFMLCQFGVKRKHVHQEKTFCFVFFFCSFKPTCN